MKHLISSKNLVRLMMSVLAVLLMDVARAQVTGIRAEIPFPFLVGNDVLPAGEYFLQVNKADHRLTLRSQDRANIVFLLATPRVRWDRLRGESRLVFNSYGNAKALRTVWISGEAHGSELPTSRAEREMAKTAGSNRTQVAVAAWSK